ncbi:hypothetical protein LBMAG56_18930 [Verrucomicrobiota bacterium]|nr:hypothetical protein LBMAG56_18930 [Verrucomicrobiota bacterium]
MILLDSNVLLDIATADPVWLAWSEREFCAAAAHGPIPINPIIYAELAPAFATVLDLDRWLDPALFQRLALPYAAGWVAAQAFVKYWRAGGTKTSPSRTSTSVPTPRSKAIHSSRATRRVIAPTSPASG